ncbi:MAG: type II CRISPR RNA-guided endonuclease Cas9 [Sulfurovum sp.]|nr:type II CRISPR RNA-guided endonuclease Cas9 [Sulfurovum sp.]
MVKICQNILGLEIGISSISWAVINYCNQNTDHNKIIKSGVRIFTQAEHPKDGSSLALPRRLARGTRRTLKRKRQRMKQIKNLLVDTLGLTKKDLFVDTTDETIYSKKGNIDIWQLRKDAVKCKLSNTEFARVLTHIAKHRGYKSNRKVDEQGDSEGKKVLSAIEYNKTLLTKYETIGQAIYETHKDRNIFRNKKEDYSHSVSREMLLDEIATIFKKQQHFNNHLATDELKDKYIEIAFFQRDFASVDGMVGKCTLEQDKLRAARRTYSAEEFMTLTKLINTKIVMEDGKERGLTQEELEKLISLCKQSENPTYIKMKKAIKIEPTSQFKNVEDYETDKEYKKSLTKITTFKSSFQGYHSLRHVITKALSKTHWHNISQDTRLLDDIGTIFSIHKSDEKIKNALNGLAFTMLNEDETQTVKEALISSISFRGFIHLSLEALEKLLPYLREGKCYDEAMDLAGYKKKSGTQQKFLRALTKEEQSELTSPIVRRAITQTRKVVNALIREYGQFDAIHIALTSEIKKSYKNRKRLEDSQRKKQALEKKAIKSFMGYVGREPKENELLKFMLWEEQDGYCAYSGFMGEKAYIQPKKLITDAKYTKISHILPYSRSFDDSPNNKVLCLAKESQEKKNMTPFEYFNTIDRDWSSYETYIKAMKGIHRVKKSKLLKKNFNQNVEEEFQKQNVYDTTFTAHYIKNFIEENLELTGNTKEKVSAINNTLIKTLRYGWGVDARGEDTYLHYAINAIIAAFATQNEVQKLSIQSAKIEEFGQNKEKSQYFKFTPPVENFEKKVQKCIDEIFVSHMPRRKVTGAAHEETIYSPITFVANRKKENPSILPHSTRKRAVVLNMGKKLAKHSSMPRIDIFQHKDSKKYYVVPLYVSDFVKKALPNKAIVQGKNKNGSPKEWLEMDENYEFKFSLFKGELVEVQTKKTKTKKAKNIVGYFVFAHSATGAIILRSHDNSEKDGFKRSASGSCEMSLGIQNVEYVKKYQVDALGNRHEVKQEPRMAMVTAKRKKRIKAKANVAIGF